MINSFTNIRITVKHTFGQLSCLVLSLLTVFCFLLSGCNGRNGENKVVPPLTSPLSRDYIGFGVITASFTHLNSEPEDNSQSLGVLRRGSLVRIIRRQTIRTQDDFVTWVMADGTVQGTISGWLKEEVMEIFNNESQARTASDNLLR
ncbi:MAG: hypothetical protein LBC80_01770 [Treponema sp.]|jgi:hypothetical protein|nr:hypothetical protein [Treponema sp.]